MAGPRIVSLLPSATETVAALGMLPHLVGRSHECDYPEEVQRLPALTAPRIEPAKPSRALHRDVSALLRRALSVFEVDVERLRAARPDVILTQHQCAACAVGEEQLEDALADWLGAAPVVVSLAPSRLAEVWEDFGRIGEALDIGWAGRELASRARERVEIIGERLPETAARPRVACIEWLDPPMLAGNWIPDLLAAVGAEAAGAEAGHHSSFIHLKDLAALDPDGMILMPCGFDLTRTSTEGAAFLARKTVARMRAVRAGAVWMVDGNAFFNRPGPRLVASLEILAEILHPGAFNFGHEGRDWDRVARD